MNAQELLEVADDELILGWRDSEWTGIAPFLEEDVAFSSIAQNEVGHARALYELAAERMGTTADELAFDRKPEEYRSSPFVEARRLDWAQTIARHVLYEAADEIRLEALKASDDEAVAGLAAKMDREEAYHRIHAEMWRDRLHHDPQFQAALDELWPAAVAMLSKGLRPYLAARFNRDLPSNKLLLGYERGEHAEDWRALWTGMTEVRRSVPGAAW